MAPTESRVAKTERQCGCCRGTPTDRQTDKQGAMLNVAP